MEIADFAGYGIEVEGIDGEVAAGGVLLHRPEANIGGMAVVEVGPIVTKGGDLEGALCRIDHRHGKARPDKTGLIEDTADALRPGIGGDVDVLEGKAKEAITDAAAHKPRLMAMLPQLPGNPKGGMALGRAGQGDGFLQNRHGKACPGRINHAEPSGPG